jgi:glycogen phosphorylase
MEFGLHESLPIYSGGLGILAGDHCKAASDLRLPLVAVGLFYHQGYFTQRIDSHGSQQALYLPVTAEDVPLAPVRGRDGEELRVTVPIRGAQVQVRIWQVPVGHIRLVLLDCDVPENAPEHRSITYQLYGGGQEMRIQQEIVLGVGGVRALRAMGLSPTVWHINEGHAAFSILERVREQTARGVEFEAAVEAVAAATVFTTHTVVQAGHDRFPHALLREFLGGLVREIGAPEKQVLALGAEPGEGLFNMTAMALRGSRFANGVSEIHREVASRMERYVWPQVAPEENPLRAITNGVHLSTFMARVWVQVFHDHFPEWTRRLLDERYWQAIDEIPYFRFVAVRQRLKRDLLTDVHQRLLRQHARNGTPEAMVARITRHVQNPAATMLVLGFARRFATYKRAALLLRDRARLARILNDSKRPAIVIFAGKAHPRDEPGQALIRELHAASMEPDLIGRLLVVEGYDLHFARNLVQGCDVWLNTPEYPLEACGTSGMKAGINGVVNVSVLDGWWPEGYDGSNGFAIRPVGPQFDAEARAGEEARQLLDILETQVVPRYYGGKREGWSEDWVRLSKNSMKTLIPRFNAQRMMQDYLHRAYAPASRRGAELGAAQGRRALELAQWKQKVRHAWDGVRLAAEPAPAVLPHGERLKLRVRAQLNGLAPEDLTVECLLGRQQPPMDFEGRLAIHFAGGGSARGNGEALYELDLEPMPGLQHYRIRAYPRHRDLIHPFEMGCMAWL